MKTIFTLLTIMLLNQSFSSVYAGNGNRPFTAPSSSILVPSDLRLLNFTASNVNNKTILQWEVTDNVHAYQFEVEKSHNGKKFKTAGLVFGSDVSGTGAYMYYEKAVQQKTYYRVKIVDSRQQVSYSAITTIEPGKKINTE